MTEEVGPARQARRARRLVDTGPDVKVVLAALGESWTYYNFRSVAEAILLVTTASVAWRWPRRSGS